MVTMTVKDGMLVPGAEGIMYAQCVFVCVCARTYVQYVVCIYICVRMCASRLCTDLKSRSSVRLETPANDYTLQAGVVQDEAFATAVNSHQGPGHCKVMSSDTPQGFCVCVCL